VLEGTTLVVDWSLPPLGSLFTALELPSEPASRATAVGVAVIPAVTVVVVVVVVVSMVVVSVAVVVVVEGCVVEVVFVAATVVVGTVVSSGGSSVVNVVEALHV